MSQTSYSVNHGRAYEGTRGDSRPMTVWPARNTSAGQLDYGRAVIYNGAATNVQDVMPVTVLSGTGQTVRGFVLADLAHEPQTTGVAVGERVNLLTKGTIWMMTEQDVTQNDPVFIRHTVAGATGTSPAVGKVRKDADTAKADALTTCRFMSSALAGEMVLLEVNIP